MTLRSGDDPGEGRAGLAGWSLQAAISLGVALACAVFVFAQMRPNLLLANTTPAGGDMGAHVWGPAFLRDHVLTQWRLSSWTPDWYAGFPAYQYYMVAPALLIVAINAGFRPLVAFPLAVVLIAGTFWLTRAHARRVPLRVAAVVVALLLFSVPYGISFKLVTVLGLVAFPLAAWAMARMASSPEPIPAFAALAATLFLFDTNFEITGGNVLSTLAGEFCFSISLALALLAIGLSARGMDRGRGRVAAAVVIGLVALCHIIPVFFMIVALVALVALDRQGPRLWPLAVAIGLALVPVGLADNSSFSTRVLSVGAALVVLAAMLAVEPRARARAGWLLTVGPVAVLLASIWLLPFVLRHPYFNDMGWERLTTFGPKMLTLPMKVALPVAALGLLLSVAQRERLGLVFGTTGLVAASAVVNLPAGALWNERLLPFYYLSVYLLAGVGVALVVRFAGVAISEDFARPNGPVVLGGSLACLLATLIAVSLPLQVLPFGQVAADRTYHWLAFTSRSRSKQPSWTAWNYSGYERKPAYREYHDIVETMAELGKTNGCGRAMWEYSKDLDRYGTPMALMLLPFWTDSCIGSMEGLYFESSATTPFHFLNQSTLSESPSRAQRDLPYQGFSIEKGISQLQVMGVRYYMAQTDSAIDAARKDPRLTEVAQASPFVVFQVAGSDLVQGLAYQPVVTSGQTAEAAGVEASRFDQGWLGEAVRYYNNPGTFHAMPAADGPPDWARISTLIPDDGVAIPPATVTNIEAGTSTISFDVDQVGSPVLVKASYFPNWKASGAAGPWRIGPNLMVVVPTRQHVTLNYGRTGVDWLATFTGLLGVASLVVLARRDRRRPPGGTAGPEPALVDEALGDEGDRSPLDVPDAAGEPIPILIGVGGPGGNGDGHRSLDHAGATDHGRLTAADLLTADADGLDHAGRNGSGHGASGEAEAPDRAEGNGLSPAGEADGLDPAGHNGSSSHADRAEAPGWAEANGSGHATAGNGEVDAGEGGLVGRPSAAGGGVSGPAAEEEWSIRPPAPSRLSPEPGGDGAAP